MLWGVEKCELSRPIRAIMGFEGQESRKAAQVWIPGRPLSPISGHGY
jgi:hypothetical protein